MSAREGAYLCSLCSSGLLAGLVLDHLNAQHQALPSHIPNDVVLLLQGPDPLQQEVAHLHGSHQYYQQLSKVSISILTGFSATDSALQLMDSTEETNVEAIVDTLQVSGT